MVSWTVDYDPAVWLPIPAFDVQSEAEEWLERAAGAVCKDFAAEFDLAPDYPALLRAQLDVLLGLAHRREEDGDLLAHLPGPGWEPVPVFVGFREPVADSPDYLLDIAGARAEGAVQPPVVEHIVVDDLGEGIRVLRYEDSDDMGVIATLTYAWRAHETDVIVYLQTNELADIEQIDPDLQALARSIRPAADARS